MLRARQKLARALRAVVALVVLLSFAGPAVASRSDARQTCCCVASAAAEADTQGDSCSRSCPCERGPSGCSGECCSLTRLIALGFVPRVALAGGHASLGTPWDAPLRPPSPDPRALDRPPRAGLPVV